MMASSSNNTEETSAENMEEDILPGYKSVGDFTRVILYWKIIWF